MQAVDILHYFTAYKTTLSYSKRYDTTVLHNIDFTNKVTCLVAVIMFNVPSVITITMENVSVPSHQFLYISILFIHHTVIQKLLYLTPWMDMTHHYQGRTSKAEKWGWCVSAKNCSCVLATWAWLQKQVRLHRVPKMKIPNFTTQSTFFYSRIHSSFGLIDSSYLNSNLGLLWRVVKGCAIQSST